MSRNPGRVPIALPGRLVIDLQWRSKGRGQPSIKYIMRGSAVSTEIYLGVAEL
jgi:hypothetical protein